MNMYEAMEKLGIKICPKCGKEYTAYPALSRRDNKTLICPDCGVKEAIEDHIRYCNTKRNSRPKN